jgi:hypothetical protein
MKKVIENWVHLTKKGSTCAYGPNMHVKKASTLLTITGINKSHAVLKQFTPAANVADP